LALGDGATLDITSGALVLDYSGASPAATIRELIASGRGGAGIGASWNGPGITSSLAAAANQTAPESQSIGFAENALLPLGRYADFRGITVDETSVLIAYTRTGDANLDSVVNDDDVTIVGATYMPGVPNAQWALGDFDYNGFVDDDDVTLLDAFYDVSAERPAAPILPLAFASSNETSSGGNPEEGDAAIRLLAASITARPQADEPANLGALPRTAHAVPASDRLWEEWEL
jgi:hypothetical protein